VTEYVFDNGSRAAAIQLMCVERYLDPITARRLAGPVTRQGIRCWEVGAGAGSVARILARAVGPSGLVLATDIDPTQLARR
jgi:ubiquinone/menaquinone biosynthesis C-methylase UbiE